MVQVQMSLQLTPTLNKMISMLHLVEMRVPKKKKPKNDFFFFLF